MTWRDARILAIGALCRERRPSAERALAERLARQDMAAAAAIANRDHQVAIGETPSPPPTPTTPLKLAAPPKNGAKPKSPAHAARRASGVEREATLDDSALRRPPMIRVDSLTSVRTDT